MTWKDILKENRLTSQNVTHTKVDENDPEPDDDRCKKKLEQLLKDLDKRMRQDDITGPPNMYFNGILSWESNLAVMLEELRNIPEETCCEIIEGLRKISSGEFARLEFKHKEDMKSIGGANAGLLTVRDKQMFSEIEEFAHPDSIPSYLESPCFYLGFNQFLTKYVGSFELNVHLEMIYAYKLREKEKSYQGQKDLLQVLDEKWQLAHEAIVEVIS